MYSNIGTPNNHHFPFGTNGKIVVLGVPILKHFRVSQRFYRLIQNYSNLVSLPSQTWLSPHTDINDLLLHSYNTPERKDRTMKES